MRIEIELEESQIEDIIIETINSDADKIHDELDNYEMVRYVSDNDSQTLVDFVVSEHEDELLEAGFVKKCPENDSNYERAKYYIGEVIDGTDRFEQQKLDDYFEEIGLSKKVDYLPVDDVISQVTGIMEGDDNYDDKEAITKFIREYFSNEIKQEAIKLVTEKLMGL